MAPDHSYNIWACPNPYGGCEDTQNPSWHLHCPICGAANPSHWSNEPSSSQSNLEGNQSEPPDRLSRSLESPTRLPDEWEVDTADDTQLSDKHFLDDDRALDAIVDDLEDEMDNDTPFPYDSDHGDPGEQLGMGVELIRGEEHAQLEVRARLEEQTTLEEKQGRLDEQRRTEVRARLEDRTRLENEDDTVSVVSSNAESLDSVFSAESLGTSASSLIKESGFSADQIQSATRVFVSVVQDNELLAPLYESARNDTKIGPKKLRKHVRGALKAFAENLKEEAEDYIQHAACRLVQVKAHHVARSIASGEDGKGRLPASEEPHDQNSKDHEDSSEEETADRPVGQTGLEDLEAFRMFLTGSGAYTTLQADIHAFCTKNSKPPSDMPIVDDLELKSPAATKKRRESDTTLLRYALSVCGLLIVSTVAIIAILGALIISRSTTATSSNSKKGYSKVRSFNPIRLARAASYVMTEVVFPLTDDLFMALGLLEPPLRVGWTRIRTECACGDHFFDDFKELRTGGVAALVQEMQRSSINAKITVARYHPGIAAQRYTTRLSTWLRHTGNALLQTSPWRNPNLPGLVQYNPSHAGNTTTPTSPGTPLQQLDTVHLMSCVHRTRDDPMLLQIDVRGITTDRALFQLLQTQILQRHNRLYRILSCRTIVGIHFTKFLLEMGGSVEIREHNASCDSMFSTTNYSYCDCLPPQDKVEPYPNAEYRCNLPCPPQIWPPIGPTKLLHKLKCPDSNPQGYTWVLNRIPRRVAGELSGAGDQAAPGWGLYFQEGWDFYVFTSIVCSLFLLGSLVFAVCWWVLKHDIQGAFGVSAYMVTACGLFVAFVVSKTG